MTPSPMTEPVRRRALATDYDGTLARDGRVAPTTLVVLERLRAAGRKLIMVTGRQRPDLEEVFPQVNLCDLVVAENGALLFWPESGREELLAPSPSPELVAQLVRTGVPLSTGRAIVGTTREYRQTTLEAIAELGLNVQVIPNKRSLMILPPGVDKASGLRAALCYLDLEPDAVVGTGDAENDLPFLTICGVSVAVANALPEVKARVDLVTVASHGEGVVEVVEAMLANDLADFDLEKPDKVQDAAGAG